MSCSGLNALDPICIVATSIGHLGSSVTNSVFSSVATAFGNTADSAINWLWSQMTSATSISFGGTAFQLDLGIVSAIAAVVCIGLFIIQLVLSAVKRDGTGIGRALRGLVIATVGCAITLASLDLLLAAVDQLCTGVVSLATGDSISTLGAKIIDPAMFTGLVAGPGAILILSLIAIAAVAVVWFALVVRKMLIIITAIFAPLAFAGGVADFSRGWVRKWLEAMLALVFSKLILILIFIIGLGVLGGMGSPQNAVGLSRITGDITGLLILLVAGLSPWMALKLVHFTGEHMATLAGSATHANSGATRIIGAPQKVASMRSMAHTFAATPHHASSTIGTGASVGAKNAGAPQDSPGPRSATPSGVSAMRTAGAGVATAGAAAAAAATMHAAKSSARGATQSAGGSMARVTPPGSFASGPGGGEASSGPLSGHGTRGGRPSSRDLPSPSPVLSTSPHHAVSQATASPSHAASTNDAPASLPVPAATNQSTPQSAKRPTSFPSSVPPLRFSPPPRPPEESS
jgi:hypothetical protein